MVFGRPKGFLFPAVLDGSTLDGTNGFALNSVVDGWFFGFGVSAAGDVNGDGLDDLLIGAPEASPQGKNWAGQTYVVFGRNELTDTTPPSCAVTGSGTNASGLRFTKISCQDPQSGLAFIQRTKSSNYTVKIPSFSVGATSPVVVTATKIDNALTAWVTLQLRDVAGNVGFYDPVELEIERTTGKPQSETVTGIPETESRITVYNHDPGLTDLLIKVNGVKFMVAGLHDNKDRNVNVSGAMKDGDNNTMTFQARGRPGGSATILIYERSAKHQGNGRHGGGE